MASRVLPVIKYFEDTEGIIAVTDFCRFVNSNLYSMKKKEKEKVTELALLLVTGLHKEDVSPLIFDTLHRHVEENFGPLKVVLGEKSSVQKVVIGSLEVSPLYRKNYEEEELAKRVAKNEICFGSIPSQRHPSLLFLTIDDKTIMSPGGVAYEADGANNVRFGEYYFNTKKILKNKPVELVKLSLTGDVLEQSLMYGMREEDMVIEHKSNVLLSFNDKSNDYYLASRQPLYREGATNGSYFISPSEPVTPKVDKASAQLNFKM